MNHYTLTQEEENLLKDFEDGKFTSVKNLAKEKKRYVEYAKNTLNKTKAINIRLSERDLHKIKVKSFEGGIPYQTLLSSLIHQYANGKLNVSL